MSRSRFIAAEKAHASVAQLCHVLRVAPSGYYAWRHRRPSPRAQANAALTEQIRAVHDRSRSTYGAPRVHAEPRADGQRVSRKRVARLMRVAGPVGRPPRRFRRTTVADPQVQAEDLVRRQFVAPAPDRLWFGDITYIRTWEGWLYLAIILDAFSRRVVGWAMADHLRTELATAAVHMALRTRRPEPGLIHHTDRGVQGGFKWSSQQQDGGVAMADRRKRRSDRAGRPPMRSPGRPTVARRAVRQRFWAALRRGLFSEDAAAEAGVSPAVGARWFRHSGGMPSISLAPVSGRYLSFSEREAIALLHARPHGVRAIARRLGRSPPTVSRELRRNAATRSGGLEYRPSTAQWHADRRARRPKVAKLARHEPLRHYVQERLAGLVAAPDGRRVAGPKVRWIGRRQGRRQHRRWATAWSPEQIAKRLPIAFPDDASLRVSHEAIYQARYIQGRGARRREWTACLRTGRALRVPRARTRGRGKRFVTAEVLISQRPAEVADRCVPGHWEGDLIVGLDSSALGTLVERTTRFTGLLHLPRMIGHAGPRRKNGPALAGHGAQAVPTAIASTIARLPEPLRRSLTWDQGAEMAQHVQLRIDTGLPVFFCDPHSPWQRGTNENTNGLLRQYFPKGTDLSTHTVSDLAASAAALNGRPRKTLGWRTPAEALNDHLLLHEQAAVARTP